MSRDAVKDTIANLPTCGLFKYGKLVAYGMLTTYGGIGKLYVDPEHRRKGLGAYLLSYLSRTAVKDGFLDVPFVGVSEHNETSIAIFDRLGFKREPKTERFWYRIVKKQTSIIMDINDNPQSV